MKKILIYMVCSQLVLSRVLMADPGDVASPADGKIKPTDALATWKMILGKKSPQDMDADVYPVDNPDGKLDLDDVRTILRHYLGKVTITKSSKVIQVGNNNAPESFTEDAPAFTLTGMVITGTSSSTVTATLTLSNAGAGTLSTGGSGAVTSTFDGTVWRASGALADVNTLLSGVTFTPSKNWDQNFTIATLVSDGVAPAVTGTKNVTVTAINDLPTISSMTNQTTAVNTATNAIAFTVSDVETAAASLTVTGSSSNKTLVPDANIVFGGSGGSRTVTVTPASGQSGSATITVAVNDGKATANTNFSVTVSAPVTTISSSVPTTTTSVATTTSSIKPTTSVTTTTSSVLTTTTVAATTTIAATSSVSGQDYTNSLGMKFKLIPAGMFTMGCTGPAASGEDCWSDEKPTHQVTISKAFYMGTTEITQGQWKAVMGTNPSYFSSCGDTCPVEQVSWDDLKTFITKLNAKGEGIYRLPTEAEWEYVARAGTTTAWSFGDNSSKLGDYGWFWDNAQVSYSGASSSGRGTHPVATKLPNPWGIYDMHGNVWEWVQDWNTDYSSTAQTDPIYDSSGSGRVFRGGSWGSDARFLRSALRNSYSPVLRDRFLGARLARTF
ncbi:MAG: SUMF1/EgtB/PvdO family nonheme iron enzyme [Magnetococcus sp. YQC-5]